MTTENRNNSLRRIKSIEKEFLAIQVAMKKFMRDLENAAAQLPPLLQRSDFHQALERLEGTYIIRLFAEFEATLRSLWAKTKSTVPPTRSLLEAVSAKCRIDVEVLRDAQAVREYRNGLVHDRSSKGNELAISRARANLCRYLSFLPLTW